MNYKHTGQRSTIPLEEVRTNSMDKLLIISMHNQVTDVFVMSEEYLDDWLLIHGFVSEDTNDEPLNVDLCASNDEGEVVFVLSTPLQPLRIIPKFS